MKILKWFELYVTTLLFIFMLGYFPTIQKPEGIKFNNDLQSQAILTNYDVIHGHEQENEGTVYGMDAQVISFDKGMEIITVKVKENNKYVEYDILNIAKCRFVVGEKLTAYGKLLAQTDKYNRDIITGSIIEVQK